MRRGAASRTLEGVDRDEALSQLPFAYATALRLSEEGVSEDVIARAVAVDPQAVRNLLHLANTKLDELMKER